MKKTFLVCMALMMIAMLSCENEPNRYNMSAPYEINYAHIYKLMRKYLDKSK